MGVADLVSDGPLLLAAPVAAAAGLLSFLSPCVLPLVPGYLSFVTGLSGEDLRERPAGPAPTRAGRPARAGGGGHCEAEAGSSGDQVFSSGGGAVAVAARPVADVPDRVDDVPDRMGELRRLGRVTAGTTLFVLGFTAVFVSYGAAFGGLGQWLVLHQVGLSQVLGAVTIVMGLGFAGMFSRISWASREWRFHRLPTPGLLGAPVLGILFGLGWTPCMGPTLSAVLGLAVQSATAGRGAFLAAVYCLGLGLPFLVVGLAFRRTVGALRIFRRHARALALAGGALLVAVGVLQLTGGWTILIAELRPYAPGFSETPL